MKIKKYYYIIIALIALAVALTVYFRYHHLPESDIIIVPMADSSLIAKEVPSEYGIPKQDFGIFHGTVKRNQTLGNILSNYNLPPNSVQHLIELPRQTFDVRKIRDGNHYAVFTKKDSLQTLQYFIYEKNAIDYVVMEFTNDTIITKNASKPIITEQRKAYGSIETSLWNTMIDNGHDPLLANELSEIYAWSIDFFGLQKGDSFSIVYNARYVDTNYVGYGKVHAAYFYHSNKSFYAIPFIQDSTRCFYDENGQSLRKAFLKAPLKYSRISSGYSNSRFHPVLKIYRPHHGVDYAAPSGTPVYAIGDGTIIKASKGYNNGGGNVIKIKHNSVYTTAYLHLSGFAKGIKTGKYVSQGELIAYVGSTGLSTGPHLDFRFYKNGKAINPLKVEAPPVEPIHKYNQAAFDSAKNITLKILQN